MDKGYLIIFIILSLLSITYFFIGFHNVDYCHNMKFIVNEQTYQEVQLNGDVWTFDKCYTTGLKQIIVGFLTSCILCIAIGYTIGRIKNE